MFSLLPSRLLCILVWMVYLVKSATHHFTQREIIRRTWGSVSQISKDKKIVTLFLLGKPGRHFANQQKLLQEENEQYHDILQCDFIDAYHNLTIKVLSSFRWILLSKLVSVHYTFCDDDSVMNIAKTLVYFREAKKTYSDDYIVCGFRKGVAFTPNRHVDNKWYIGNSTYPGYEYPTFCHGAMWMVSRQIITDLYCVGEITNATGMYIDDVFITGILREKLKGYENKIHGTLLNVSTTFDLVMYADVQADKHLEIIMSDMWKKVKKYLTNYYPGIKILPYEVKFKNFDKEVSRVLNLKWKKLGLLNINNEARVMKMQETVECKGKNGCKVFKKSLRQP